MSRRSNLSQNSLLRKSHCRHVKEKIKALRALVSRNMASKYDANLIQTNANPRERKRIAPRTRTRRPKRRRASREQRVRLLPSICRLHHQPAFRQHPNPRLRHLNLLKIPHHQLLSRPLHPCCCLLLSTLLACLHPWISHLLT